MDWNELTGQMPAAQIVEALDDDGDGIADIDAWAKVQADAEERLHACFGGMVPPAHAVSAAVARKLFLLESLYIRRGITENNPFTARAKAEETRLRNLASGDETTSGDSGAVFVGEPAKVSGTKGMMA